MNDAPRDLREPCFSRPPQTNALGPCDTRMDTTVPEIIAEEAIAIARMTGKNKAEWLRDLIIREVRGQFELVRLRAGLVERNEENSR